MTNYQQALYNNARDYMNKKDYKNAIKILRQLCSEVPDDVFVNFYLGKLLIKSNRTVEEGKKILIQLMKCDNERIRVYSLLELGKLELNNNDIENAKKYYEKALTTTYIEGKSYAIIGLGKIELLIGNDKEAKKLFESLLDTKLKMDALLLLGKAELFTNNIPMARQYFNRILGNKDVNNKIYAMLELAFLEIHCENYIGALSYIEKILSMESQIYEKKLITEIKKVKMFLYYKLGTMSADDISKNNKYSYFFEQLFSYNKSRAIYHIEKHLDNDIFDEEMLFDEDIDIHELYGRVINLLDYIDPKSISLTDKYVIECDSVIGTAENVRTSNVEIITFSNSNDIITMYPTIERPFYNQQASKINSDMFVIEVPRTKKLAYKK